MDITKDIKRPVTTDLRADVDGIFIKSIDVPDRGTFIPQHSHTYDHVSFIASGAVWLETKDDGVVAPVHYTAPALITIKAHVKHLFLTTEPNTRICCIHRIDRTDQVEVDEEYHLVDENDNPKLSDLDAILIASTAFTGV